MSKSPDTTIKLFHCGVKVSGPFWPLTHFGTLRAAMAVMARRLEQGVPLARLSIHEVTVREPKTPFIVKDFGSPRPMALLVSLLENEDDEGQTLKRLKAGLLSNYDDPGNMSEAGKAEHEIVGARRFLAREIRERGYDAVIYANSVEDSGSVSHVVLSEDDVLSRRLLPLEEAQSILASK